MIIEFYEHINTFVMTCIISFICMLLLNYIPSHKYNFREELDLLIGKYCFHIHHWISIIIIIIIVIVSKYASFKLFIIILGILVGCLCEDFLFKNIYNLRNCK